MDSRSLDTRFCDVRSRTESLAAPLSPEDQTVQSMPDVSPTKWHRAHTTWFFETFVLADTKLAGHFDPSYDFLFNSYYEQVGPRYERSRRGHVSRPGAEQVGEYRRDVDERMRSLLADGLDDRLGRLVVLGLHHEQQHQELLLMDIKHVLSQHPQPVAYVPRPAVSATGAVALEPDGTIEAGVTEIGATGAEFCFDNEQPRHRSLVGPSRLEPRLVTSEEYRAFIDDGGYERPELWLSEGWAAVNELGWHAPLYWSNDDDVWRRFTLFGTEDVRGADPVSHVSYFEADAYARWRGARLPTEFEWEVVARGAANDAPFGFEPPASTGPGYFGSVWQWTQSAYSPYPGFRVAPGAVGEYNGKFMVNQQVLRGSASITPEGHARPTYRNFFPASARWAYSGIRLAWDAS